MGKFYAFVLGIAAGAGLHHLAMSYHVVHASDGLHLTAKVSPSLKDVYVDIRQFTAADAVKHPELGAAIVASDNPLLQREYAGNVADDAIQGGIQQAIELLQKPQ